MPGNVTTITQTVTSSTGITSTFTVNHTTTTAAAPFLLFGLPPELVAVFTFAIVGVVIAYFRLQVKGLPVLIRWLRSNYSAVQFRAQEDLRGIYLYVLNARGKREETITKTGKPFQVKVVDNKSYAYLLRDGKAGHDLSAIEKEELEKKGWKIVDRSERYTNWRGKELPRKAYLIEKKEPTEQLAYLDIAAGGQKMYRMYDAVEGTGTTLELLDVKNKIDAAIENSEKTETAASSGMVHEELAASKSFLDLLAEAMQGSFKTFLIPFLAGGGVFGMAVLLVAILSGHLH